MAEEASGKGLIAGAIGCGHTLGVMPEDTRSSSFTLSQPCTSPTTTTPSITAVPCPIQVFFIPELTLGHLHEGCIT